MKRGLPLNINKDGGHHPTTFKISCNRNETLSEGNFGTVFQGSFFRAKDGDDPIPVAVSSKINTAKNDQQQIDLEEKLMTINHQNVAKLLYVEDQISFRCYAFEMWDASLEEFFQGQYSGPLPSPANFLLQLASGLKYIHENDLVHRNISPEQTLFSAKDRQMKWSGFSLFKTSSQGPIHSDDTSSPIAFLAPEIINYAEFTDQRQDQQIDFQHTVMSNIFGAGCIFAQFLTGGFHPFGEYRQNDPKVKKDKSANLPTSKGAKGQDWNDHDYGDEDGSMTSDDEIVNHHQQSSSSMRLDSFEFSSQAVSNIHANNPINMCMLSAHYAYGFILKMLDCNPEQREEGLSGILDYLTSTDKLGTEFLDLCAVHKPTKEEMTQLRRMIRCGDVLDINKTDDDGNTPLILFCRNRTGNNIRESVEALMEDDEMTQEVDVNKKNLKGYNALHYLFMNCKHYSSELLMEIISLVSEKGVDLNAKDSTGATAIHYLCKNYMEKDLIDLLNKFVQIGVDLGIVGPDGWTALHYVSRYYDHENLVEVIQLLTEKKTDLINCKTSDGWTALHYISRFHLEKNLINIIRLLVGKGADVNYKTFNNGYTALHYLCQCYPHENLIDIVRLLVDNQADVSAETKKGDTALEILQDNYPDGDIKAEIVLLLKRSKTVPTIARANERRAAENDLLRIKYDRNKVLGTGCFSIVFLGTFQEKKGEPPIDVAVKRIEIRPPDNQQVGAKEFGLLEKLDHPNVVKFVYSETHQPDFRCFALELCQASLEKLFLPENDPKKYKGPIPSPANVLIQLSKGLEYIHSKKLAHRDIKPDNVLISANKNGPVTVKWADFGLSKEVDDQGCYILSTFRGAMNYWPLETYEAYDRVSKEGKLDRYVIIKGVEKETNLRDIFAAGCLFAQFLTGGKHPFGSPAEVKNNIEAGNPRELTKYLSAHYAHNAIRQMLNNRPEKRHGMLRQLISTASRKIETEFLELCSLPNPTEEQIKQLRRMVRFNQADVNQSERDGYTPVILLCRSNRKGLSLLTSLQALMVNEKQMVDLNKTDTKGYNALLYICMNSAQHTTHLKDMVKLLVETGIDVNATDDLGRNALFHLCRNYSQVDLIELVRILLDENINVNNVASTEWIPLHLLCRHYTHSNLIDIVRLLVDKGADVNWQLPHGVTPLHSLCQNYKQDNLVDIVRLLVEKGASVNCKLPDGLTTLHILCRHYTNDNLIDVVRLLVDKRADVNCKNLDKWTALHVLCRHYNRSNLVEVVRLLVDKGVDVDCKNSDGWTALHIMCRNYTHDNLIDIVRLLVGKGVDVGGKTAMGNTALSFLKEHFPKNAVKEEIIKILLDKRKT